MDTAELFLDSPLALTSSFVTSFKSQQQQKSESTAKHHRDNNYDRNLVHSRRQFQSESSATKTTTTRFLSFATSH